MSTAQVAAPAAASPHGRPWGRGRFGLAIAIAIAMFVAFLRWKNQLSCPNSLVWTSLSGYLDRFQTWLSDSRNVAPPSFVFSPFDGFATFLDNLVSWLTSFFHKLTWAGTTALATLVVRRLRGRGGRVCRLGR